MRKLTLLLTGLISLPFKAAAVLPTVPTALPAEAAPSYAAAGLLQAGLGLAMVVALIFVVCLAAAPFRLSGTQFRPLAQGGVKRDGGPA